ncbi:MAG: caspase family protein [Bacteroidales bacterium]|nr:caspase family protein [Bacteroidales bacterium]
MKKLFIISALILISLDNAFTQNTVSFDVAIFDISKIKNEIEKSVNDEINQWQLQGRYESTEEFIKRVNSKSRENKVRELTILKINELANSIIFLHINELDFDPDNEVYKITFVGIPPIYLHIPVSNFEAKFFDTGRNKLKFIRPRYTLTNDGFALLSVSVQNPINNKIYNYDYRDKLVFKRNNIQLAFAPVTISSGELDVNVSEKEEVIAIKEEINIDKDIPGTKMSQPDAVAIVIGNKEYQKAPNVDYAINDALSFRNYFINVLGLKSGNIIYLENINKSDFEELFGNKEFNEGKLFNMVKPNVSDVYIYYSGHGAPGLKSFKGYFLPVDCDPNYIEFRGYSIETFYENLAKLPAKSVTVIQDACFSGEDVYTDISASILPKVQDPAFMIPNGVLISSSAATEPSCWYSEQQHGLFTYFFLRAIKDKQNSDINKDGKLSFQEIYDYISSQTEGIPYYARRIKGKKQTPTIKGNSDRILVKYL